MAPSENRTAATYPETRGRTSTVSTACSRPVNSSHSVTSRSTTFATVTCGGGGGPCCADVCEQPAASVVIVRTAASVWRVFIGSQCATSQWAHTIGQWPHMSLARAPYADPRRPGEGDLRLLDDGRLVHQGRSYCTATCLIIGNMADQH